MMLPKTSTGYNIPFSKKQVTDKTKFTAIKNEIYSVLSIDELSSMKITENNFLELKPSIVVN